jgi:hypothetical protein
MAPVLLPIRLLACIASNESRKMSELYEDGNCFAPRSFHAGPGLADNAFGDKFTTLVLH